MEKENIYKAPKTIGTDIKNSTKPNILTIIMGIIFSVLLAFIGYMRASINGDSAEAVGAAIGATFIGIIVVVVFQIIGRFRNSRSRWKVFTWTQFIVLIGQIGPILRDIGENTT